MILGIFAALFWYLFPEPIFSPTKTEALHITSVTWATGYANMTVVNNGALPLTITEITVNNAAQTWSVYSPKTSTLAKGDTATVKITFSWITGANYTLALFTASGNKYTYTTTASP